ncbi:glycosyltransferase family A protein, partial [Proteus mirabilis]
MKNEKNRGVSYSRNVGIYNSIGKFILFLDSDDQYK